MNSRRMAAAAQLKCTLDSNRQRSRVPVRGTHQSDGRFLQVELPAPIDPRPADCRSVRSRGHPALAEFERGRVSVTTGITLSDPLTISIYHIHYNRQVDYV